MIKTVKTKQQIRSEIDSQIESFLNHGGEVSTYQAGESGRTVNEPLPKTPHIENTQSSQSRTPVMSEIQAIEARRKSKAAKEQDKPRHSSKREKKVLLTDDFGEPLRWISE